jgi:hypothetical protein
MQFRSPGTNQWYGFEILVWVDANSQYAFASTGTAGGGHHIYVETLGYYDYLTDYLWVP